MESIIEQEDTVTEEHTSNKVISESERLKNLSRVQFTKPKAKNIISHHAGCEVLTQPEYISELTNELIDTVSEYFKATSQSPETSDISNVCIKSSQFRSLLHRLGYRTTFNTKTLNLKIEEVFKSLMLRLGIKEDEELLISRDFAINIIQRYPSPSHFCGHKLRKYCSRGKMNDVIELLIRGCDVNVSDGDGLSALHYAAEHNKKDIIQILYEMGEGSLKVNSQDKYGWTALHSACYNGNFEATQCLLEIGAVSTIGDVYGKTPLHFASGRGHSAIVTLLLENGVSASTRCRRGMTPAHDAAFKNELEVYSILSRHPTSNSSIRDELGYTAEDYVGSNLFTIPGPDNN